PHDCGIPAPGAGRRTIPVRLLRHDHGRAPDRPAITRVNRYRTRGGETMSPERKQVALVTGATSGIGLAITKPLARQGFQTYICARNAENLKETVRGLREDGLEVDGTACAVRSRTDIEAFVRAAVERYGPVDVLVNNAGRSGGGITTELGDELWFDVI